MTPFPLVAFVVALAVIETPNGVPDRPGPAGETGRWQLTPAVRDDRTRELSARGVTVITDELIAREHVVWLRVRLAAAGVDPSPFNVALAWNAGLGRVLEGKVPESSYGFAARATRLTDQITRNGGTPR